MSHTCTRGTEEVRDCTELLINVPMLQLKLKCIVAVGEELVSRDYAGLIMQCDETACIQEKVESPR